MKCSLRYRVAGLVVGLVMAPQSVLAQPGSSRLVEVTLSDFWYAEVPPEVIRKLWSTDSALARIPPPRTVEVIVTFRSSFFREFVVVDGVVAVPWLLPLHEQTGPPRSSTVFVPTCDDSARVARIRFVHGDDQRLHVAARALPFRYGRSPRTIAVNLSAIVGEGSDPATLDYPGVFCCRLCFVVHDFLGLDDYNCACCAGWCKGVLGVGTCR